MYLRTRWGSLFRRTREKDQNTVRGLLWMQGAQYRKIFASFRSLLQTQVSRVKHLGRNSPSEPIRHRRDL